MSQKLLEGMLSPVTEENKQRIRTKYPNAHKGDNILEIYEEKQVFTAKTLFMTQLGRIDIRTGGNHPTVKPYDGQISELFSHGSRTMYTLPSGDETIQESMQQAWKGRTQEKGGLLVHRAATHEISRRQVNDQGEMTSPAQEKKLGGLKPYFKENGTLKIRFKPTSYFCNYGMNMPIGGMGNLLGDNTVIDDQGGFGRRAPDRHRGLGTAAEQCDRQLPWREWKRLFRLLIYDVQKNRGKGLRRQRNRSVPHVSDGF